MAEALDVFADVGDLLQVLVLPVVEDGVVNDDAVDGVVSVGGQDGAFELFPVEFAQGELASTAYDVSGILDRAGFLLGGVRASLFCAGP